MPPTPMTRVVATTDRTDASLPALAAATRIALGGAELVVAHVGAAGWSAEEMIAELTSGWGTPMPRLRTESRAGRGRGDEVRDLVAAQQADLVVMTTAVRTPLLRFLRPSVAEHVARGTTSPALLLPRQASPMVDAEGGLRFRRVLMPISSAERHKPVISVLLALADTLRITHLEVEVLHVTGLGGLPMTVFAPRPDWQVDVRIEHGDLVETILARAEGVDLIAMGSRGHDTLQDTLWGSTTERVLHASPCPVLEVPLA